MSSQQKPIKVLFHLNQVGYGGTEKAVLTFCQNFDTTKIEPYLFVYKKVNTVKYIVTKVLALAFKKYASKYSRKYINPYVRLARFNEVLGADHVVVGDLKVFTKCINSIQPDIVHFNRGDWDKFFVQAVECLPNNVYCVETSVFGRPCNSDYLKRLSTVYVVSQWLLKKSPIYGEKAKVLYNPIKAPANSESLREQLNIPKDAFVMGRISRPDLLDDEFILNVMSKLNNPLIYLLVLAGSDLVRDKAKQYSNIKLLEPTTDEQVLSKFYNTLDLLLHYRVDGETFGMNIAEAMIHGKPVVSHMSEVDNAQAELLSPAEYGVCGFVANQNNIDEYINYIERFYNDRELLEQAGINAKRKSFAEYHEKVVTNLLTRKYETLCGD